MRKVDSATREQIAEYVADVCKDLMQCGAQEPDDVGWVVERIMEAGRRAVDERIPGLGKVGGVPQELLGFTAMAAVLAHMAYAKAEVDGCDCGKPTCAKDRARLMVRAVAMAAESVIEGSRTAAGGLH
jgi:hypothetical protein